MVVNLHKLKTIKSYRHFNKVTAGICIVLFAAIGTILLFRSHAATPFASIEPELGAVTPPANTVSDVTASGGKYAKFSAVTVTPPPSIWTPALNTPYMLMLEHPLNTANASDMGTGVNDYLGNPAPDPLVYDIDGFDNPVATLTALHGMGKKVVCYISAGSWEEWRPDAASFPASVKGSPLAGWAGELWLDIRQISILGPIMQARMDMCKSKGYDAIDFDNVDGYTQQSGFAISAAEQLTYNKYLAAQVHNCGLAAALKNEGAQLASLWQDFDFSVNEQCNEFAECADYKTYFINNNKAVFQVEYNLTQSQFCPTMNQQNFNSLLMPLILNGGRKPCR